MKRVPECPECKSLERKYELAVGQIYAVVDGRFNSPRAKVRDLHRYQDRRDDALKAWLDHRASHRVAKKSSRRERDEQAA